MTGNLAPRDIAGNNWAVLPKFSMHIEKCEFSVFDQAVEIIVVQ